MLRVAPVPHACKCRLLCASCSGQECLPRMASSATCSRLPCRLQTLRLNLKSDVSCCSCWRSSAASDSLAASMLCCSAPRACWPAAAAAAGERLGGLLEKAEASGERRSSCGEQRRAGGGGGMRDIGAVGLGLPAAPGRPPTALRLHPHPCSPRAAPTGCECWLLARPTWCLCPAAAVVAWPCASKDRGECGIGGAGAEGVCARCPKFEFVCGCSCQCRSP